MMCQPSRCSPKGVNSRRCASKDAGPLGAVPHRLEEGKSVIEDVGPRRGWIVMSHIGWEGERTTIYKVWKPSPKPEREGKAQKRQSLLVVT